MKHDDSSENFYFLIQIFFNLLLGTIALGSAMPNLEFFAIARASAVPIFETIERVS